MRTNENAHLPLLSNVVIGVLAVLATLLVLAVLTNTELPVLTEMRAIFIAVAVLGFAMCAVGPLTHMRGVQEWLLPENIVGALLGVLAALLIVFELFEVRFDLIPDARAATIALAVVLVAKLLIALIPWRVEQSAA